MNIKSYEEEYDYLEQMISFYKQKENQIKKTFKKMDSYSELNYLKEFLTLFLPANLIVGIIDARLDAQFFASLEPIALATLEAQVLFTSYILCRVADKVLNMDTVTKKLEKVAPERSKIFEKIKK